jgi:Trypsin
LIKRIRLNYNFLAICTMHTTIFLQHPDFVNSGVVGYPNDISVLVLATDVNEVAGKVQYAPITTNEDWVGAECYITGWGRISGQHPFIHTPFTMPLYDAQQLNSHACVAQAVYRPKVAWSILNVNVPTMSHSV